MKLFTIILYLVCLGAFTSGWLHHNVLDTVFWGIMMLVNQIELLRLEVKGINHAYTK